MQKFSCASNLACLYILALTRHPGEAVGQSFCYFLELAFRLYLRQKGLQERLIFTVDELVSNFCDKWVTHLVYKISEKSFRSQSIVL